MGLVLVAVFVCLFLQRFRKRRRTEGEGSEEFGKMSPTTPRPYPHLEKYHISNGDSTDGQLENVGQHEAFVRKLAGWRSWNSPRSPPISLAAHNIISGRNLADRSPSNEKVARQTPSHSAQSPSGSNSPTNDTLSCPAPANSSPLNPPPVFQSSNLTPMNDNRPLSTDLPPTYSAADPTRTSPF
ncbi:hypothetical protein BJ165DRAFT_746158 [Panaeolus papilionaceus]|nr:hypothetical protein BJ165DRAFT_746158 [Panaeolus papilionaceus]